ncbi:MULTISPECIES: Ig-like domain-containing protein, partial [unclassified Undibacterium]
AVKFGLSNASSFTVNSATQITATAPAGSGTVDITVVTMGGTSSVSVADNYTYTVPTSVITFATPSSAAVFFGGTLTNAASATLSGGSYGAITYSSSNTAVATVSASGVIATISVGTSTITATQAAVTGVNAQATQSYSLTISSLPLGIVSFSTPSTASIGMGNSLTNAA